MSKRIAVLASGNGTNFQALADACFAKEIDGEITVLVSNKKYAHAMTRARSMKIEALLFDPKEFSTRTLHCSKMAKALNERNIELVCLAGYMLKVEPCLLRAFPNRILNIHPALLPKFGGKGMFGRHVHEAVIAAGEKESGCTVHLLNENFDEGPIIAQSKIKVEPTDTPDSLAEKIHPLEHKLYVQVVKDVCSGKLNLDKVVEKTLAKGGIS
jgi:phosphoribosylglycinamide formyltransferase-1